MGLAITVGNPAMGDEDGEAYHQRRFARLAQALADAGHAGWTAPPEPAAPWGLARPHTAGFPYSYLHRLQRVYALHVEGQPVTPVTAASDLDDAQETIADATSLLSSHLLCHSDTAGYFVPAPLGGPVFLPEEAEVAGAGMVGSSQGLLRELVRIAPLIGVRLEPDGTLTDAEADRVHHNDGDPYESEQTAWLALHESCLVSVATGQPIVYH
jgi:hypothetical protein